MVTVHAAHLVPKEPGDYGANRNRWKAVCGSLGMPISDDIRRVTCENCIRIIKQRGIVL
jgi:hypothetical protein